MNGDFDGTEVSVMTVWTDEEGERFQAVLDAFNEATGITVVNEGTNDFETLITVRVEGGNAPDVAVFPQPTLMASFVEDGAIVDLGEVLNMEELQENYIQSWIDLGTVDGQLSGVFFRASTKSLVWYPKAEFEAAGYEVPATWDELIALSDQIVADGGTPWCISIEDSGATGWLATDWVEDIMLRTAGPDVYDQWVAHEIPFNDPAVVEAIETMGGIWMNPDYVYGGTTTILTTWIADIQNNMFTEDGPNCWLHRQAGWISSFFPEGTEVGTDADFFYLPPIEEEHGSPVLGGGDVVSMFNDRPEVRAFLQFLATPEAANPWIELGGFIPANRNADLSLYPAGSSDQQQAEIMANATVFRFDASDLMPPEVGAGTFWTGMTDWVSGDDLETVLQEIEDSWPE
jgi:alpha-glucoside transport system substrate-binding protein